MASNYWLKLYHEMLDDPKVMTLRPALRWRFVETLLVAGEMDEGGLLPSTDHYAWRVRAGAEVVESELAELADAGLLSRDEGKWLVTKFAERQAAETAAERMRRMRERNRKQEYYRDETEVQRDSDEAVTNRNTDKIREDIDTDEMGAGAVFSAVENDLGHSMTPMLSEKVSDAIDEFGAQWVLDAIGESVANGVYRWKYAYAILKRWGDEGRNSKREPDNEAGEAWCTVEEAFRRSDGSILREHPKVLATINVLGGWGQIKRSTDRDVHFLKQRFLKEYANVRV